MNVMINKACNLNCSYCFANESMENDSCKHNNMTREEIEEVIIFHKKSGNRGFRIIGGEPTLHPHFDYLISRIAHDGFFSHLLIFSNITFEEETLNNIRILNKFIDISILPNINEPEIISMHKTNTERNLKALVKEGIVNKIGINLYSPKMNIDYIFDTCNKFGIKQLRYNIVMPNEDVKDVDIKKYFSSFSGLLNRFFDKAIENNISLHIDCNSYPVCLYDDLLYKKITQWTPDIISKEGCSPVVDIRPGLEAIRCFAMSSKHVVKMNNFNEEVEIKRHFENKFKDISNNTLIDECNDCPIYKKTGKSCGCLAYKL